MPRSKTGVRGVPGNKYSKRRGAPNAPFTTETSIKEPNNFERVLRKYYKQNSDFDLLNYGQIKRKKHGFLNDSKTQALDEWVTMRIVYQNMPQKENDGKQITLGDIDDPTSAIEQHELSTKPYEVNKPKMQPDLTQKQLEKSPTKYQSFFPLKDQNFQSRHLNSFSPKIDDRYGYLDYENGKGRKETSKFKKTRIKRVLPPYLDFGADDLYSDEIASYEELPKEEKWEDDYGDEEDTGNSKKATYDKKKTVLNKINNKFTYVTNGDDDYALDEDEDTEISTVNNTPINEKQENFEKNSMQSCQNCINGLCQNCSPGFCKACYKNNEIKSLSIEENEGPTNSQNVNILKTQIDDKESKCAKCENSDEFIAGCENCKCKTCSKVVLGEDDQRKPCPNCDEDQKPTNNQIKWQTINGKEERKSEDTTQKKECSPTTYHPKNKVNKPNEKANQIVTEDKEEVQYIFTKPNETKQPQTFRESEKIHGFVFENKEGKSLAKACSYVKTKKSF